MKTRKLVSIFALALAAGSGVACSSGSEPQQPAADESTSTTQQAQILGMAGNIMAWPAGPIAWNGLVGTWPVAVWSPGVIGGLAFDVAGVSNLGITVSGFSNLSATTISSDWLNAFVPTVTTTTTLGAPFFGTSGIVAPAWGFNGAFNPVWPAGFGFGAFGTAGALPGTWANNALTTGWNAAWLTPTLTSSALMFNNLAALNTMMPYTFNLTFQAASAAQAAAISTAALSVFATPALTAAASMPFMSMAFPIMLPLATPAVAAAPALL